MHSTLLEVLALEYYRYSVLVVLSRSNSRTAVFVCAHSEGAAVEGAVYALVCLGAGRGRVLSNHCYGAV